MPTISRLACSLIITLCTASSLLAEPEKNAKDVPKVAALVTAYFHNSHADVIVSRLLQSMTLDGKGEHATLKLASIYIDQPQSSQVGLGIISEHQIPIFNNVAEALTLGGKSLAVDGVLLIGEHGTYPLSATQQVIFPKRRLFTQVLEVFDRSGRVVPVFSDKHLADNWEDAKWLYDSARRRGIPLMAGSSVPGTWRHPARDLRRGAKITELFATSYSSPEAYGFHGLEVVQCLAERRAGGETGVRSVQMLSGDKFWEAVRNGIFSRDLFEAAVSRCERSSIARGKKLDALQEPFLYAIQYNDGLRANLLWSKNIDEWTAAWRDPQDGKIQSTLFWTQEARPYMHFAYLLKGIQKMMHTGKPTWPVERTLMTTGMLNAAFISKKEGDRLFETPYLNIHYQSNWDWHQPPDPPPGRPSAAQ